MAAFLIRRLLLTIPTLLGVTLIVFIIVQVTPGDPAELMLGPMATEEGLKELRERLGLDQPIIVQYFTWLGHAVRGDFGRSFKYKRPVSDELLSKAGNTAILVSTAILIASTAGIGLGLVSSNRPNSRADRVSRLVSSFGVSMPEFWLGIVLILIFAVQFELLPTSGMRTPGRTSVEVGDLLMHLILPAVTLATPQCAIVARLTRASLVDVMHQDYIRTARAKGLTESLVFRRHMFRNVLIPLITVIGWQAGFLLGATILVETIFAWPGLGQLMVLAVSGRDFPLLQGVTLVVATAVVIINILVDISYALINPRVRVQ